MQQKKPPSAPTVSIIIPCFNGEVTISGAVESALAQSYPRCEVIVIDDGSTDGSLAKLQLFGDRIKILTGPNRGGAAARNRGLSASTGEFIQFLDADDLLRPDKVAACLEAAKSIGKLTTPVTDWSSGLLNHDQLSEQCAFPADNDCVLSATLDHSLQTAAPLHRRGALEAILGFRENLKCCQEKDLHLRLVAAGHRFYRLPIDGVVVRRSAGSVSSSNLKVLLQRREVLAHLAELLRQSRNDARWQPTLANVLTRDAFDLANAGRLDAAWPNLALARQLDPAGVGRKGLRSTLPRALTWLLGVHGGARTYTAIKKSLAQLVD